MIMNFVGTLQPVCVQVDDVNVANQGIAPYNSWNIDGNYQYSDNCMLSNREYYADKLNVYPNPTTGVLHLDIEDETKIEKIEVYDFSGKIIKEIKGELLINIESLASGNYLLRVFTSEGVVIKKIIKK